MYKKKSINGPHEKKYSKHKEFFKKYVKTDDLEDYATWREWKTRIELKKTKIGRKTKEGLTSTINRHRLYVVHKLE